MGPGPMLFDYFLPRVLVSVGLFVSNCMGPRWMKSLLNHWRLSLWSHFYVTTAPSCHNSSRKRESLALKLMEPLHAKNRTGKLNVQQKTLAAMHVEDNLVS